MPAKDLFHNTVKTSLEKDDWTITDEHLFIQVEDIDFYIELAAERILAAEKNRHLMNFPPEFLELYFLPHSDEFPLFLDREPLQVKNRKIH